MSPWHPSAAPVPRPAAGTVDDAVAALAGRRLAVLTGAGVSTDSGIPDYRSPDAPPRRPMTYQQFVADAGFRRHYWARNHVGWRHVDRTRPNGGHEALADLERRGVVTGLVTQNVDLLHQAAGSRAVIDLHGRYDRVACLRCAAVHDRAELAARLDALNPGFAAAVAALGDVEVAPDADAVIEATGDFRVADCWAPDPEGVADRCGGVLKPDIVYFGESVPRPRAAAALALVERADALLVAGSSLAVYSGLRLVRRAAALDHPVVIVNRGPSRGDDLATVTVDAGVTPTLRALADRLPDPVAAAGWAP